MCFFCIYYSNTATTTSTLFIVLFLFNIQFSLNSDSSLTTKTTALKFFNQSFDEISYLLALLVRRVLYLISSDSSFGFNLHGSGSLSRSFGSGSISLRALLHFCEVGCKKAPKSHKFTTFSSLKEILDLCRQSKSVDFWVFLSFSAGQVGEKLPAAAALPGFLFWFGILSPKSSLKPPKESKKARIGGSFLLKCTFW